MGGCVRGLRGGTTLTTGLESLSSKSRFAGLGVRGYSCAATGFRWMAMCASRSNCSVRYSMHSEDDWCMMKQKHFPDVGGVVVSF